MPNEVDNRVVQMQFNNEQFEHGVQKTLSTLDKLKEALHLNGASKGLENIEKTSNKFSLDGITSAIDSVNNKFSTLGVIGFSVLNNLVSKATDAGVRMVKALSVDQIAYGWAKFGQKTGSVATLISQGYALEEVNKQMDRLNWFTDETSYNYTDMASNIAKFTATGQDLESSVTAMMGIANWAALSGQNATVASRAMYQLSQAMSKGALRYDDFRSIQNASMDTKEFREQSLEAAVALGTIKKNLDGTYTVGKKVYSMNEMFTSEALTRTNWYSSEVMMKTFQKYSSAVDQLYDYTVKHGGTASQAIEDLSGKIDAFGLKAFKAAQEARSWADVVDSVKDAVSTGWMSTFESIFGNYDQATKLWTSLANNLYDVFMFGTEKRNELFAGWNELGGHTSMINTLENSFEFLLNIMEAVQEALQSVFPPITSETLYNITLRLEEFSEKLKDNDEIISNVKTVFTGFFHILNIGKKVVTFFGKTAIKALKGILEFISPLTDKIKPLVIGFSEWITEFDKSEDKFKRFKDTLDSIKNKLTPVSAIFDKAKESIKRFFSIFFKKKEPDKIEDSVKGLISPELVEGIEDTSENIDHISEKFEKLGAFFDKLKTILGRAAKGIKDAFSKIREAFSKDDGKVITNFVNTGFIGIITFSLKKFIDSLTGASSEGKGLLKSFKNISKNINKVFGTLNDSLTSLQNSIKSKTLKQIAVSIAILAGSVLVLSLINPDRLSVALLSIASLFTELGTFVTLFEKANSSSKFKKINQVASSMIKMSVAIIILASAMKNLSTLSLEEIGRGLLAITGLITVTTVSALLLSRFSKKVAKGAKGMIQFSVAIAILAKVMKSVSSLSLEEIGRGLLGVLGLVAILTGAILAMSKLGKKFIKGSIGMILFSSAVAILAKVMKQFYDVNVEEIGKGLLAIGGIMLILSGSMVLAGLAKHILSSALAFVIMAGAMTIFAKTFAKMGSMEWEEIGKAFTVFGGILALITALSIILDKTGSTLSLIALSASLVALSIAMAIFSKTFAKMGSMEWEEIGKAFTVFGGSLVLIGVAGLLLSKIIPAILGVAGAFALLGLGLQLIASAFVTFNLAAVISNFSESLRGISKRLKAGTFVVFFKNVLEVLKELVRFVPLFIASFIQGIIDGFILLANSGSKLIPALVNFGNMVLSALELILPRLVEFGLKLILSIGKGVDENLEQIIEVAGSIIFHFLVGLSNAMPLIITGAMVLMYNFIVAMAEGIRFYQDLIFSAEKNLLSALIEYALSSIQEVVSLIPVVGEKWSSGLEDAKTKVKEKLAPEEMKLISAKAAKGLADGFRDKTQEIEDAGEEAAESGVFKFSSLLSNFQEAGENSTSSFANGLLNNLDISNISALTVGEEAKDEMGDADYDEAGYSADQGFANGLLNNSFLASDAASIVGTRALDAFKDSIDSHSPSKAFEKEGFNSDKGFANGLLKFSDIVEDASGDVGDKALTAITSSISRIGEYISENIETQPTIRPVLDMTGLKNGVSSMDNLMNRSYSLSQTSYSLASQNAGLFSGFRLKNSDEKTDKGVINAIGNLRGDVQKLNDSFINAGVYIDGKRAGKILTPNINRNLYVESVRKGRNN